MEGAPVPPRRGLSGIAAADGPLPTFGSGISPNRAISWTHCPGAMPELKAPAALRRRAGRTGLTVSGANSTRMLSL